MISTQVLSAVQTLQAGSLASADGYELDLADRALDELLRRPDNPQPAAFQLRSARANAAKVLRSRRVVLVRHVLRNQADRPGVNRPDRLGELSHEGVTDTLDWLATTPRLSDSQRRLLLDLAAGEDARSLANQEDLPIPRVQERISRARRAGWSAHQADAEAS